MLFVRCSHTIRRLVIRPVAEKSMAVVPPPVRCVTSDNCACNSIAS